METMFDGSQNMGTSGPAVQAPMTGWRAPDATDERSKTMPYLPFVAPGAPAIATPGPSVQPQPEPVAKPVDGRPPVSVALMLFAAMIVLAASGSMAVRALLDLV